MQSDKCRRRLQSIDPIVHASSPVVDQVTQVSDVEFNETTICLLRRILRDPDCAIRVAFDAPEMEIVQVWQERVREVKS
jgi:hypothetical protein